MSGARGWTLLALMVGGLGFGCREQAVGPEGPTASEREGRSEVLRGLTASKERAPDPESLKGPTALEPRPVTPAPPGQGGSGRAGATHSIKGQVAWVGDNELLLRDAGGEERDLEVNTDTQFLRNGDSVSLRALQQGDEVRVSYDEGTGGWVARQVEVLPVRDSEPLPEQNNRPRQGRAPGNAENPPPR